MHIKRSYVEPGLVKMRSCCNDCSLAHQVTDWITWSEKGRLSAFHLCPDSVLVLIQSNEVPQRAQGVCLSDATASRGQQGLVLAQQVPLDFVNSAPPGFDCHHRLKVSKAQMIQSFSCISGTRLLLMPCEI
jgi:hypothetical protein